MLQDNQVDFYLIGCASGIGGVDATTGKGPLLLQQAPELSSSHWSAMIQVPSDSTLRLDEKLRNMYESLAKTVSMHLQAHHRFCVVGGDHSCAVGTWSGVYDALHQQGDIGLIWVDAHMDSHTPETSLSGRIHGMPLASLLGYGYSTLTSILHYSPKIKPENVCLIGVRSYEAGEAALLQRLNVKIFYMEEVKQRGLMAVWQEAIQWVNRYTIGYGVSLDMDSIDPVEAPGVCVPEPGGLKAAEVGEVLSNIANDPRLIVTEIVEFDPMRDKDRMTEKWAVSFLTTLMKGKPYQAAASSASLKKE